jgi:signal transduction histidine kinase
MTLRLFEPDSATLLRALTQISHAVSNAASLDGILRLAAEQAAALLDVERSLVLLTDDTGGLRVRAQRGLDHVPSESFSGPLDERLMSTLANALGDASSESVLAVPLVVRGHVTGLFAVGPLGAIGSSDPRESVLTALADQMAAPLENARLAEEVRDADERFRLATEGLAGFVYDWHANTNRIEYFGGMYSVLGFEGDAVPPDPEWWKRRVHPDDLPRALRTAQAALQSEALGWSVEYRVQHADGHYVDLIEGARIVRDADGQAARAVGGMRDISARRRLEREREALLQREREARAAAEAAVRARDEILAVVSHDLRNPLGAIALCAGALLETIEPSSDEQRRILQGIEHAAASTDRLIRDLLDVASMEAGHLALDLHDEAPGAILTEAAEMFAAAAHQRGVALETQTAPDLPTVRADAGRVLQGLANLVMNALKFTEPGGRITLRSERDPGGVRFAVEDTGAGIAAEDLPHVFDRYWQKRQGGVERGTGLGLAIVRGIVDAHSGQLSVESAPGKGSQFSFTLPTAGP